MAGPQSPATDPNGEVLWGVECARNPRLLPLEPP